MLSGSQWDIWRWLAHVGGRILLGRESCLRPGPRPVVHTQNHLGRLVGTHRFPASTQDTLNQNFLKIHNSVIWKSFPFSSFLILSAWDTWFCCFDVRTQLLMRRDGRLRQWRKDRQGGDRHQCERLLTRVQGPLSAEKAEEGPGAWALMWLYDLWQVSQVCWVSVSLAA